MLSFKQSYLLNVIALKRMPFVAISARVSTIHLCGACSYCSAPAKSISSKKKSNKEKNIKFFTVNYTCNLKPARSKDMKLKDCPEYSLFISCLLDNQSNMNRFSELNI